MSTAVSALLRLNVISDNSACGRDGWNIDQVEPHYWVEGLVATTNWANNSVSIFPNPAGNNVRTKST